MKKTRLDTHQETHIQMNTFTNLNSYAEKGMYLSEKTAYTEWFICT